MDRHSLFPAGCAAFFKRDPPHRRTGPDAQIAPLLMRDVAGYFASPPERPGRFQTGDAGHDRTETRVQRVSHKVDQLVPTAAAGTGQTCPART